MQIEKIELRPEGVRICLFLSHEEVKNNLQVRTDYWFEQVLKFLNLQKG